MTTIQDKVKRYFDKIPNEWNHLYSEENRALRKLRGFLRKGLYERYNLTFQHCGEIAGARVLDIGCGTGQYSIEFAKRGAARVVGIDIAPSMTAFAQQRAQEFQVSDRCDFICDDFLSHQFNETFDIVVALGFFDYTAKAEPYFKKIFSLTEHRFLASFPGDSLFWGTQRKIRYYLIKRCPVYFYTSAEIIKLYKEANFSDFQVISSNRGSFGIGIKS